MNKPSSPILAHGILLLLLAGCSGQAEPPGSMGFPPPEVTTLEIQPRNLPVEREYIGQTRGSREVEIRPRVGGIIEQRRYQEGALVQAGEPLFQLDPSSYEAQLAAAEAVLNRAHARLKQTEREWNRLKPLAQQKTVSRQALDDARSDYELAQADIKAAQAAVKEARLQREYTEVVAPITGYAGLAEQVEGAVVSAATDRLTTITVTDPMDVYFSLSENEWLLHQRQQAEGSLETPNDEQQVVKLRLADGRIPNLVGHINFEAARLDPNTGTVTLRARLPNPEGLLKSGQFVRVLVTGATRPNAIAIPQKAVLEGPQGKFVYVLGESGEGQTVAQFRPIEVGEWIGKDKERDWIIRNGLQAGDRVILDNLIKVRPGAPVSIASPAPPANTTNDAG